MKKAILKPFCLLLCVFSLWGCGQRQGGKTSESQPTESPNHEMLSYEIGDAGVTITDCDTAAEGDLAIPAEIEGLPVTSIGDNAFAGCKSLTSIALPGGVISIGRNAFQACTGLTSINIPESVTSIGSYGFINCFSLTSITIPEGVTSIEDWTFLQCGSLTSITIPEGVTSIGGRAFQSCRSLTSVTIPESVNFIEGGAFLGCDGLTSISIPQAFHSEAEASRIGLWIWPDGFLQPDSSSN